MSMSDEELRKLCEAATPGPWVKAGDGEVTGGDGDDSICIVLERYDVDDAAFIAAAREAIPRLLAEKERLREALEAFAVYGIPRIDHTPTRLRDTGDDCGAVDEWWQRYFLTANEHVKEDARAALEQGGA